MKRNPDSWASPARAAPVRDRVGTVGDLHASATRLTGLTEFGEDDYIDGLSVLLASYERDKKLTALGQKMQRVALRSALAARLVSEAAWQRYPEYTSVPVDRPILRPRAAEDRHHRAARFLAADPANQGLELWLTQMPQPRPPRETWASDPIYVAMNEGYKQHHVEHPEFMGLHLLAADQVEECWRLLWQSMRSISFECLAHLPTYSSWLESKDWTDAYRRHRRNLQLIGMNEPKRRWVLKNPSHLFALDELLAVYPDALIIQTHRLPRVVIGSACSLSAHATAGWSERFVGPVIGEDQLELWARGLDEFMAARVHYDQSHFCDVRVRRVRVRSARDRREGVRAIRHRADRCGRRRHARDARRVRELRAGRRDARCQMAAQILAGRLRPDRRAGRRARSPADLGTRV